MMQTYFYWEYACKLAWPVVVLILGLVLLSKVAKKK